MYSHPGIYVLRCHIGVELAVCIHDSLNLRIFCRLPDIFLGLSQKKNLVQLLYIENIGNEILIKRGFIEYKFYMPDPGEFWKIKNKLVSSKETLLVWFNFMVHLFNIFKKTLVPASCLSQTYHVCVLYMGKICVYKNQKIMSKRDSPPPPDNVVQGKLTYGTTIREKRK